MASGKQPKCQKAMMLQEKVTLFAKLKEGNSYAAVAHHFGVNESTVCYSKKKEAEIRKAMSDCRKNIPFNCNIKREKTRQLYQQFLTVREGGDVEEGDDAGEADFLGFNEPVEEEEVEEEEGTLAGPPSAPQGFQASKGWFHRFQRWFQLKSVSLHGEAASADMEAAAKYPETFKKIIGDKGYHPQQVFNMDETGLFWKMPSWTYLMKDKARASGFKAQKDRVTFINCGSAAGFMLKPGLIYKGANPRALKTKNKGLLPVFWMHNPKAWITKVLTDHWFIQSFIPQVEQYLNDLGMEFKVMLIMDNAGGHPVDLYYDGVQLEFPWPTPHLSPQPMDQGLICAFKALYIRNSLDHLVQAMDANSEFTLKDYWCKFTITTSDRHRPIVGRP
ncbi:tigger transposable element-derived protein 1-like [Macrobrachium rosenbergii]|uniref:tigger transposable element-derived protein 1-like n=1 Tax=Macrobrachium rosenbergii TaxID=79674 RepID=UPI0034D6D58A